MIIDTAIVVRDILLSSMAWSLLVSIFLVYRSLVNFTRTGPRIRDEIAQHFAGFARLAFLRLVFWVFAISLFISLPGAILYSMLCMAFSKAPVVAGYFAGAVVSFALIVFYLFSWQLLHIPGSLQASAQFRFSRLLPYWKRLRPGYFAVISRSFFIMVLLLFIACMNELSSNQQTGLFLVYVVAATFYLLFYWAFLRQIQISPVQAGMPRSASKNVIMLGTDTLRTDRLGLAGYPRNLTPFIDQLAKKGVFFNNCYTPLARTAPALASMFSGLWPQHHRIRDNYPDTEQLQLPVKTLIGSLNDQGYETAAVADWAGADLGKINFGFKTVDAPNDQWNLKYLIRQGPAEIRLFLSLFTHNDFGKKFLPEIFYLAGVPLTRHLGRQTRKLLSEYAQTGEPFFLTFFSATTHVPFGSDYPYYTLFTDPEYTGESRFTMTKLATPEEIIEKQELGKEAYDVDQIINLYDGCVRQFDDEVKGIVGHLQQCGLQENTIIVIYSDHGADFFETGCWGQGNTLFGNDPSNRVPLLIIDPSKKGGFKVNQVTRVVDFLPTMQQLMGIESSSESDGVSLVDLMEQPDKPMRLSAYQETGMWLGKVPGMHPQQITYPNLIELLDIKDKQSGMLTIKPEYYPVILKAKNRSIRNERWKLIYIPTLTGVEYMLFDMQDDPGCLKDVREKNPDVFDELKARLDAWIDLDAG